MIPRIKSVKPLSSFFLEVVFDDGKKCIYDVEEDIKQIKSYEELRNIPGLFQQVKLDTSRTCVFWNENIDLPSDTIYEYGKVVRKPKGALQCQYWLPEIFKG